MAVAPDVQDNPETRGVFLKIDQVKPGWWRGELRLNATESGMSGIRCAGEGAEPSDAVEVMTRFASAAMADPVINAALPPGAQIAVHAVRDLARAAKRGELQHVVQHFGAPVLRAVSSLLSDATNGLMSGFGPICLVCPDGSSPKPRAYDRQQPDFSDDKRFPGGRPSLPVPYDPGVPAGYIDPQAAAAEVLGRARAHAHHHRRR